MSRGVSQLGTSGTAPWDRAFRIGWWLCYAELPQFRKRKRADEVFDQMQFSEMDLSTVAGARCAGTVWALNGLRPMARVGGGRKLRQGFPGQNVTTGKNHGRVLLRGLHAENWTREY